MPATGYENVPADAENPGQESGNPVVSWKVVHYPVFSRGCILVSIGILGFLVVLDGLMKVFAQPCQYPLKPTDPWPTCLERLSITTMVQKTGDEYINAVKKMKKEPCKYFDEAKIAPRYRNLSWYDLMDTIHGTNYPQNSYAHMGVHFGTWHRVFMWFFDTGLNAVRDPKASAIAAPFWDWTVPTETMAMYNWLGGDGNPFDHECIPGPFQWPKYNITIKNGFYPLEVKQWQCITRAISQEGTAQTDLEMASHLPSRQNVLNTLVDQRYDNQPWDDSAMGAMSFRNNLEGYGTWNNEGADLVKSGHRVHGFHNIVHLDVGDTMATLVSPNDPMFWTHHGNIDRMLQNFLVQSGELYGLGYPRPVKGAKGPLTKGYPAQIVKVDPACLNFKVWMTNKKLPGFGVMFQFGDGSNKDFAKFLLCSYARDPSGPQIVGSGSYGKRILLGYPKGSKYAAHMPPIPELYTDQMAFEAKMNRTGGERLIYESFVLTIKPRKEDKPNAELLDVIAVAPNHFESALAFSLLRPPWFNAANKCDSIISPKTLHTSFGDQELPGMDFKAIAVTHGGWMKMNLEGYSPDHYWMPGYMKAIHNLPITLQFGGQFFTPAQSCYNDLPGMENYGCKTNGTSSAPKDQFPVSEGIFSGQTSNYKFTDPYSSQTALLEITGHECLTFEELKEQGYLSDENAAAEQAKQMMPEAEKFCVVSGYFIGSHAKDEMSLKAEWAQTFGSGQKEPPSRKLGSVDMNKYLGASLAVGQYPQPRQSGEFFEYDYKVDDVEGVDVTDHIYIGARPGGNAQDSLQPWLQMGFDVSPADVYNTETARYESLYTVPSAR